MHSQAEAAFRVKVLFLSTELELSLTADSL